MSSTSQDLNYGSLPWQFQALGEQAANNISSLLTTNPGLTEGLTSDLGAIAQGSGASAAQYLNDVLSGKYLDFSTNPAYESLSNEYIETVSNSMSDINKQAQQAGQFFSGANTAAQIAEADMLTEDFLNQLGDLYETERGYQQDALTQELAAYSSAIDASNLGIESTSNLISAALGGGTQTSGWSIK